MDLDLTAERLRLEDEAARMLQEWLRARVAALYSARVHKALEDGEFDLIKARKHTYRPAPRTGLPGNWTPEALADLEAFQGDVRERHRGQRDREPWQPWNVFEPGERYVRQRRGRNPDPTIAAGREVFEQIIDKAYQLGLKEAASALLLDRNPPREYRHYTRKKLQTLARKNVKLVDTTTRRMVRHVTSEGKPDNADELLQKLYSTARCQGIALDQVSKGYIRGAAEVLRQNGYRYIYWRTMKDEKVCPICGPRESQPFTVMEFLKRAPAHPRCRCFPSTTRFDGSRDPDLHAKSFFADWRQQVRSRQIHRRRAG